MNDGMFAGYGNNSFFIFVECTSFNFSSMLINPRPKYYLGLGYFIVGSPDGKE